MNLHATILLVTNYLALVITVWLGWYVVTRSPRNPISWLTTLTALSVGGLFLFKHTCRRGFHTARSRTGTVRGGRGYV